MATRGILFRVDAGPHVGLGHLQRCLSLAVALNKKGAKCHFLINAEGSVRECLESYGFPSSTVNTVELVGTWEAEYVATVAAECGCVVTVVDSYDVNGGYLAALRATGLFVVAVDDLARFPFPCQLVISSGAHASNLDYRSSSGDTHFLLGTQYVMLRPEFWDLPPRSIGYQVENVLVATGGADPHNLLPNLLGRLDAVPGDFSVTVFVGPFFQNGDELESLAGTLEKRLQLVYSPKSVHDFMLEADVAVSAGGQTLYELAATGTPMVAFQAAKNQASQLEVLAAKGLIEFAGTAEEPQLPEKVAAKLQFLLRDTMARGRMSLAGQQLVDGRGALRVADAILQELESA